MMEIIKITQRELLAEDVITSSDKGVFQLAHRVHLMIDDATHYSGGDEGRISFAVGTSCAVLLPGNCTTSSIVYSEVNYEDSKMFVVQLERAPMHLLMEPLIA